MTKDDLIIKQQLEIEELKIEKGHRFLAVVFERLVRHNWRLK